MFVVFIVRLGDLLPPADPRSRRRQTSPRGDAFGAEDGGHLREERREDAFNVIVADISSNIGDERCSYANACDVNF